MKSLVTIWCFCPLLLVSLTFTQSRNVCRSSSEFRAVLKKAAAGSIIELADGSYNLGEDLTFTARGTLRSPIIIKSQHRGKARLVDQTHFILTGTEYVVIEGFIFECTNGPAIALYGCNNIRITRNIFQLRETTQGSWLVIDGIKSDTARLSHHNRVDHNIFTKKSKLGNFISIDGTMRTRPQVSRYDRIDHNLFKDIGPRVENVLEALRVGWADYSLSSGFTVVEENLFERCDGDPEYISIKSSDNTIRHNTFRECLGSLSLRHGNRNTVEGNFILGNYRTGIFIDSTGRKRTIGTGGLRFYGDSMFIFNNYLEGLSGTGWDAAFAIPNGNAEYGDGQPLTKHFRIRKAVIAFNTIVNSAGGFEVGFNGGGFQGNWWRKPPEGIVLANNLVVGSRDTLIKIITWPDQSLWMGNIIYPTNGAVGSGHSLVGVVTSDPKLVKNGGLWELSSKSPAIDAAQGDFPTVKTDIEGKKRGTKKDVGAFEMIKGKKLFRPLTAKDVGPYAK